MGGRGLISVCQEHDTPPHSPPQRILSANDPTAFSCVFGIARAGAVWCPINPRNAAAKNAELLDLFDCSALIFHPAFDELVAAIAPALPKLTTLVRLGDGDDLAQASATGLTLPGTIPLPRQHRPRM